MAAPPEVSIDDLSGKYVMNSTLSDSPDPMLALQGLSWFLRSAISLATVTISATQYTEPAPTNTRHIDLTSVVTGGISTTHENRILDWQDRHHVDKIFGPVLGRSRMLQSLAGFEMAGPGDGEDEKFLKGMVLADGETEVGAEGGWCDESGGRHVQSFVVQAHPEDEEGEGEGDGGKKVEGGWCVEQVWGFEVIEGSRYWTRRMVCRKGEKGELGVARARLVYDYKGVVEK